ncbi:MAG TPA: hypothetical protein PLP37_11070, partial [Clostridiales bacterium]|nr:hypothetical protein [Clostridiales bacterium]
MINKKLLESLRPLSSELSKIVNNSLASTFIKFAGQNELYKTDPNFVINDFRRALESVNTGKNALVKTMEMLNTRLPQFEYKINNAFESLQDSHNLFLKNIESVYSSYNNSMLNLSLKAFENANRSMAWASLVDSVINNSMKEFDEFVKCSKNFAEFTNQIAEEPERITQEDFNNFKYEMKVIYEKSNSNSKVFSIYWGFIFLLLGIIYDITQKNKEFTSEQKEFLASGLSEIKQELTNEIRKDKAKDSIERTARTNVNLRSKNSTKSKIVG